MGTRVTLGATCNPGVRRVGGPYETAPADKSAASYVRSWLALGSPKRDHNSQQYHVRADAARGTHATATTRSR